jgi:hypothetical protein
MLLGILGTNLGKFETSVEGCITNNLMTMNRNYVKMFGGLSNNDMFRKMTMTKLYNDMSKKAVCD